MEKIEIAKNHKHDVFGQYADECMKFYDGAHNFMWEEEYAAQPGGFLDEDSWKGGGFPHFKMTVNRVFEAVALFGPALFARYPQVTVKPLPRPKVTPEALGLDMRNPQSVQQFQQYMAMDQYQSSVKQSCAEVKQHYLNWVQRESDKKLNCRRALTDAIVKGLGCVYHEIHQPLGSSIKMPRSTYLNPDDYLKDPDARYSEDVEWIAIRRCQPVNRVEEKFGLPAGSIKGHLQSYDMQSTQSGRMDAKTNKQDSQSYDLIEYWEVFSKNGMGDKLAQSQLNTKKIDLSAFGNFCYLAVAKGVPYPLNLPTEVLKAAPEEEVFARSQWPVPFWTDDGLGNGWPVSEISFFHKPGCVWPISLFKPVIGEMRFINWCMSFLADRVAASSTTYIGVAKAAGAEIQAKVNSSSGPYTVVEIADILGKSINDVVSFMNSPNVNTDVWRMVAEVMERIDKATGLTELMYGMSSRQIRSAREADIKDANTSIRPDDMAEMTENWISQTVMKEMEIAAWAMDGPDVEPVLGQAGAYVFVKTMQSQGFESVVRDYNYTIEAGSARKPNKANRLRSLNDFGQVALPVIQQFAMQGFVEPWNAYMAEYGKALDMDPRGFLINLPPPPEPDPKQQAMQDAHEALALQEHQVEVQDKQVEVQGKQIENMSKASEMRGDPADMESAQLDNAQKLVNVQKSLAQAIMEGEMHVADLDLKRAQREALAGE